eukprot:455774_1
MNLTAESHYSSYQSPSQHASNDGWSNVISSAEQDISNTRSQSIHLFDSNIYPDKICTKLTECHAFDRIVNILKEYRHRIQQMQMTNNNDHMVSFHKIVYGYCEIMDYNDADLLNDFNHLLQSHAGEFEDIYDILCTTNNYPCDLQKCVSLRRNQRDRMKISENINNINHLYFTTCNAEIVSQQLLDRIHCHYLHSFDIGLKIKKSEQEKIINKEMKMNEDDADAHDSIIGGICELNAIKSDSYRHVFGLERLQSGNHKFMLDYGTDNTNINEYKYGFRFFYWKPYRFNSNKYDNVDGVDSNKHEANVGYRLMDLYISAKYRHLQDELLNNSIAVVTETAFKHEFRIVGVRKEISNDYWMHFMLPILNDYWRHFMFNCTSKYRFLFQCIIIVIISLIVNIWISNSDDLTCCFDIDPMW